MTKEFKYPKGHNWEGLTPKQVNEGYSKTEKEIIPLDEKKQRKDPPFYWEVDIKNSIQNLQEELKEIDMGEFITPEMFLDGMFHEELNKLFLKHIGKELLK